MVAETTQHKKKTKDSDALIIVIHVGTKNMGAVSADSYIRDTRKYVSQMFDESVKVMVLENRESLKARVEVINFPKNKIPKIKAARLNQMLEFLSDGETVHKK